MKTRAERKSKRPRGGCSCGEVRYELLAEPIRVHCCHCTDCQRHTGSAFVLNAIIETSAIKMIRGDPQAIPVRRDYGPHDIYRCRNCKTVLRSLELIHPGLRYQCRLARRSSLVLKRLGACSSISSSCSFHVSKPPSSSMTGKSRLANRTQALAARWHCWV